MFVKSYREVELYMSDVFHVRDPKLMYDVDYLRAIAFASVPRDASYREARSWLVGRGGLTSEEVAIACELHCNDDSLRRWRLQAS